MVRRKTPLVNDIYYHILNRGVNHQQIFLTAWDYHYFLNAASYYRYQAPVLGFSKFKNLSHEEKKKHLAKLTHQNTQVDIVFLPDA